MAFTIIEEKCVGCGACSWVCLFDVPKLRQDKPVYEIEKENASAADTAKTSARTAR